MTLLFPCVAIANTQPLSEYQVKAAFLLKFSDYIAWPSEAFDTDDTPIAIGVVGAIDLVQHLEQLLAGRTIHGRNVSVRQMGAQDTAQGLHILFIGQGAEARSLGMLADMPNSPILVITETGDSLPTGSVINFVVAKNKVRFDIALDTAKRRNLRINSRLLGVARSVLQAHS